MTQLKWKKFQKFLSVFFKKIVVNVFQLSTKNWWFNQLIQYFQNTKQQFFFPNNFRIEFSILDQWDKICLEVWLEILCFNAFSKFYKGGLIAETFLLWLKSPKIGAKSLSWASSFWEHSAQDRDLANFFWNLSQIERLSEIYKTPLGQQHINLEHKFTPLFLAKIVEHKCHCHLLLQLSYHS